MGRAGHRESALAKAREEKGWTQEELSQHAGVSRKQVSALESGRVRRVREPTITALAAALGLGERRALSLRVAIESEAYQRRRQSVESTTTQPLDPPGPTDYPPLRRVK